MSSGEWVRVGDPASRSWSPVRLSGACGPSGALSAAVRKDLNLNLSAVHENIRSRAYGQRFRNWFRVKASGSIGPMCFKSGAVACAPPIVRDESSRVFLGGALQQSPPLRRPSSMVGQFSLEVNRKDEPAVRRRPLLPSSKPAEMRAFYSGTDSFRAWPKTLPDFAFGKARLAAISECHPSMAAIDPFRPGRDYDTSAPRQCLAIVPRHPLRGVGRQFLNVALELGQIIERVGAT